MSQDSRLRKVTVLLDEQEYGRYEAYCDKRGFKKSTLAARLIREHLDAEGFDSDRPPLPSHTDTERADD